MFAKSAAGKYSLDVLSLEAYYHDTDSVILLGGERKTVQDVACSMVGAPATSSNGDWHRLPSSPPYSAHAFGPSGSWCW
jgi:hypothetical protein